MTSRIIRILLILLSVLVLSNILPELYQNSFSRAGGYVNLDYSEILQDFIITDMQEQTTFGTRSQGLYYDRKGNTYSEEQVIDLLPIKQLSTKNLRVDSIHGVDFPVAEILKRKFYSFADFSMGIGYGIKPLYERKTGRVQLTTPTDLFRFKNDGIEFIDAKTNTIDVSKSQLFTNALKVEGFVPPAKTFTAGGFTDMTEYHGYYLIDSEGKVFRLNMYEGKPLIDKPVNFDQIKIKGIYKDDNYHFYAIMKSVDDLVYIWEKANNTITSLPFDPVLDSYGFNYEDMAIYRLGTYYMGNKIKKIVIDTNNVVIDRHEINTPNQDSRLYAKIQHFIFPFEIDMYSPDGLGFNLNMNRISNFFILNILLCLAFYRIKKYYHRNTKDIYNRIDMGLILILGVYAFLGALIFPYRK
jgi:hypothetical protein